MACFKTLAFAAGCDLNTCSTKPFATISGIDRVGAYAYAPELCYVCLGVSKGGFTSASLYKYDPASNTASEVLALPPGDNDWYGMVWDPINKLFVGATNTGMFTYDPVSLQYVSSGVGFYQPIWEPYNSKIYAQGGSGIILEVDPLALNVTNLGSVGTHTLYEIAYSPLTNCLYGGWRTGLGGALAKFDLNTNTGGDIYVAVPTTQCWDSDRNLLIMNDDNGGFHDFDVSSQTIVASYPTVTDASTTWNMRYISSLKKAIAEGWFYPPTYDPIGNGGVTSLHTTDGTTKAEFFDHDYEDGILVLENGSIMLIGYTTYGADAGVQRMCLT